MSASRARVPQYSLAVVAVAVTAVARSVADPLFAGHAGFVGFILPVALAAWAGGLGPGLLATILAAVVGLYTFVNPFGSLIATTMSDLVYVATFITAGVVVSVLAAGLRSGRARAEENAFRAERLQAVAAALAGELTAVEAASAVLREGIEAVGAGRGVMTLLDPDGQTVSIVGAIGYEQAGWERFEHFPVDGRFPVSEAIRTRDVVLIDSPDELRARYPALDGTIGDGGSALVLPLLEKSGPIGALYYRFARARRFSLADREYFLALGRLGAAAIERARLHDAERRVAARQAFLVRAGAALAGSLDFEVTAQRVAELCVPALGDICAVHIVEADGSIRTVGLAGDAERLEAVRRFLELDPPHVDQSGAIADVIRSGAPRLVSGLDRRGVAGDDRRDPGIVEAVRRVDPLANLSVPLTVATGTIGALSLTTTTASGRSFSAEDQEFALQLAARAGLAIENARLYSALAARERRAAAVARLGQLALAEQDLQPLLDAVAVELAAVLEQEFIEVLQLADDGTALRLVAGVGWSTGLVGEETVPIGPNSQAGYTLATGAPVIVTDLRTETRFRPPALLTAHGAVSGMTAVIPGPTRPWGVLGVHTRERRIFTEDDTNFLVAVTNVLAGAIERRVRADAEREAQDVNRAFIGVVSHELRTPITTIYGGAKMLRRVADDDVEREALARDLEADAERLYRLTEDLLVLTRLERHDLEIASEPVLLSRLIERVIASEQKRWPVVDVQVTLPPELDPVAGEDSYVEQVLRNLLGNAVKYSPAGATIEVVVEPEGDTLAVRILDRGPGIREEDPSRLFSLFYRSPSTAQQASGAGIGLFVSEQLVRAMGGRIWARRREDGGSEFGFALRRYVDVADVESVPAAEALAAPATT